MTPRYRKDDCLLPFDDIIIFYLYLTLIIVIPLVSIVHSRGLLNENGYQVQLLPKRLHHVRIIFNGRLENYNDYSLQSTPG